MTTTQTDLITAASVMNTLAEIVDGHEDYIDTTTMYFLDEQPCCIVGHVMAAYGFEEDWFRARAGSFSMPITRLVNEFGLPFSDLAARILRRAQKLQDEGQSWGRAYAAAVEMAEDIHERV